MLTYVAAAATAATLLISPMLPREPTESKQEPVRWTTKSGPQSSYSIPNVIALSGTGVVYYLSKTEQRALKKALLKSAQIVHLGARLT